MTKKWSSTASLDGQTKRGAAKEARRERAFLLREALEDEAEPERRPPSKYEK